MNNTARRIGAGFTAGAALATVGVGLALPSAWAKALPDVDGMSWGDAQEVLESDGFSAAVASTTGDHEKWADCEVTNVRQGAQLTQAMDNVTVSLNCDAKPTKTG